MDALLIAGPTASGKSSLALALARELGGVIVNADSMQVYRELRILTARPTAEDEAAAPHRLYGLAGVAEPFSVARWLDAAAATLVELKAKGILPIVVGGTGLYFAALERGLSPIPEIDAEVRAAARRRHAEIGSQAFYEELRARDPLTAAQLNAQDAQRVIRAWEVMEATGQPLAEWQSIKGTPVIDVARTARFVLTLDREVLYQRAERRFDLMMAAGALDEAQAFAALDPDPAWPAARALGLRQLLSHLDGSLSLEAAVEEGKRETRRYAKRQMTWFRNQMAGWQTLGGSDIRAATQNILDAVQQGP